VCSSDLPNPKPQTPNPKPQTPGRLRVTTSELFGKAMRFELLTKNSGLENKALCFSGCTEPARFFLAGSVEFLVVGNVYYLDILVKLNHAPLAVLRLFVLELFSLLGR